MKLEHYRLTDNWEMFKLYLNISGAEVLVTYAERSNNIDNGIKRAAAINELSKEAAGSCNVVSKLNLMLLTRGHSNAEAEACDNINK